MSETVITAIISLGGGVVGAAIGAIATIESAKIQAKSKDENTQPPGPSRGTLVLVAIVAGVVGLAVGALLSYVIIPPTANVNTIAGNWTGIEGYEDGHLQTQVDLSIERDCTVGSICGRVTYPEFSCYGSLSLMKIEGQTFVFVEHMEPSCPGPGGGFNHLRLLEDGTLALNYHFPDGKAGASGILKRLHSQATSKNQPTESPLLIPRISISLTVTASIEWQNTRIVVEEGELVQITNDLSGKWHGDEGAPWTDGADCTGSALGKPHLLPTAPGGSLIAKVDDSDPVCVGNNLSFLSTHSGVLFLSYNDCPGSCFSDNEGSLTVQVEVFKSSDE